MNLLYGESVNKGKPNSQKAKSMPKPQRIAQWCSKPLYTKDLTISRNISNFWCPPDRIVNYSDDSPATARDEAHIASASEWVYNA